MKIGVFGGSFNPVHLGHLAAASEVAFKTGLSQVHFVVAGRHPLKDDGSLLDAGHRFRMVELALESNPDFTASRVEVDRPGPCYTIDTMRTFREMYGGDVHFILGQDAMEDVGSWNSALALLKTVNFIVVSRPGYDSSALMDVLQGVASVKYKNLKFIELGRSVDGTLETIGVEGAPSTIRIVRITPLDISSSDIRRRMASGRPIKYLVPEAVERYLRSEGLYNQDKPG
ncbi:MAG: nicotinate-nucleotide adenylyltransferase [Nitrospinae bacterium]|nr:nicotinate-nucleotide adenylyltransferase [Nitrospinota bacterium]